VRATKRSFRRICIASCGTLVTVDGSEVIEVRGDPDHPLSHGYLCPKGRALGSFHHDPARLDSAMIHRGGDLVPVGIDAALDDAAAALASVIGRHGGGSVGVFMGSGGFIDPAASLVLRRLRQQLGTDQNYSTATVDAISKVVAASLMAGTMALVPHIDDAATLVVLIGSNPLVSHGQSTGFPDPVTWIRRARERGEVVVVDPRRTETATQATTHLGLRPGTDHALLAHIVRDVIVRRALGSGPTAQPVVHLDELVVAVDPYDSERTARLTGLTPTQLDLMCKSVHRVGRLAVVTGTGASMSRQGILVEWLAWALMILTDSFDHAGGMWFNPGHFTRLDSRPSLPAVPAGLPTPPSRPGVVNVSGEWPASLLPDEIEAGRLRALIVLGSSLTTALPDVEHVRSALGQLDALIVLDVVENATTTLATHVFACEGQLERPDMLALDLYAPAVYSHYTPPVVAAKAGREPAWRVLAQLARRLGIDAIGRGADPSAVSTDDLLDRVARGNRLDELRSLDGGPGPVAAPMYEWAVARLPNGTWDLAPELLRAQMMLQVATDTGAGPDEDRLLLIPRRQLRRENGRAFRHGDAMELVIHTDDAARRGIAPDDEVEVCSDTGTLTTRAGVSNAIARGAVSLPHGYAALNVNRLINAHDVDPISGMPRLSGTSVEVRRIAAFPQGTEAQTPR
jgi:anaerobic selenocysteine-containing dehydrogenase